MPNSLADHASPIALAAGEGAPKAKPATTKASKPSRRPDAWRVNDALAQLGICRATLYKMVKNGELRLVKLAGRTLVPDSEIRRLVDGGA